jgi:hypothetical protein
MTGRRATTAPTGPTPLEEVPPTQPPTTPEPAPEPEPTPDDDADRLTSAVLGEKPPAQKVSLSRMPSLPPVDPERLAALVAFAEQQKDCYPLTVHEAIAEVTRRVTHISKEHQSTAGDRYWYRGIDDVLEALHPILGDVGLVIMPGEITSHRRETRTTAKGSTLNVAILDVRYRLIGPDGTKTWGASSGEAHDSGDKATQKALSQAYKSFALQTFSIPTQASADDDPDATGEDAAPPTQQQVERAAKAWEAAHFADSYERLAAIRQQAAAEGLLAVRVQQPNGDAPLGVLFDRRRAELEGAQS